MKKTFVAVIVLVIGITLNAQQSINIADSNNLFAFKLYNEVKKDAKANLFFSPFSISTALAMTYAGARNETEKQMCLTLHFSLDQNTFQRGYKTYLDKIESDKGKDLMLGIANSLWIANSLKLLAPFKEIVTTDYNSEARNVNFHKTEEVRNEINIWVEKKTNDKIKELIKPGIIDGSARLVLVNAIYFKGNWATPFSKDSTKSEGFYTASSTIKSNFMHNTAHYRYYQDDTLQAVEVPYKGGRTSMVIFLPKDRDSGIKKMESILTYSYYSKIISSMYSPKVIIALPKFKTTVGFELKDVLSAMGMPDAFCSSADFSGMSTESLYISHVIHKTFIDVNEEGTEAAAATAVVMQLMAMKPMPPQIFNANHPFIFVIRDTMSGAILFMGKITDPTRE